MTRQFATDQFVGGNQDQVFTKNSGADFDMGWKDPTGGGGGGEGGHKIWNAASSVMYHDEDIESDVIDPVDIRPSTSAGMPDTGNPEKGDYIFVKYDTYQALYVITDIVEDADEHTVLAVGYAGTTFSAPTQWKPAYLGSAAVSNIQAIGERHVRNAYTDQGAGEDIIEDYLLDYAIIGFDAATMTSEDFATLNSATMTALTDHSNHAPIYAAVEGYETIYDPSTGFPSGMRRIYGINLNPIDDNGLVISYPIVLTLAANSSKTIDNVIKTTKNSSTGTTSVNITSKTMPIQNIQIDLSEGELKLIEEMDSQNVMHYYLLVKGVPEKGVVTNKATGTVHSLLISVNGGINFLY